MWRAVLILCLLSAPQAQAKRKAHQVGIFPTVGKQNTALLSRFDELLSRAARDAGVPVIGQNILRKRLRQSPGEAVERCNQNLGCIGKVGKKARIDEMIFCSSKDGTEIVIRVVAAGTSRSKRHATIALSSADELNAALAEVFRDIFIVDPPASLTADDELASADLELAPLPGLGPATNEPARDDELALIAPPPRTEVEEELDAFGPSTPPTGLRTAPGPSRSTLETASITPPELEPLEEPTEPLPWMMMSSIGLAGVGLVVTTVGTISGVQSVNAYDAIEPTTDQVRAGELKEEGDSAQSRANLMFIVGGALMAAGGLLFALDTFLLEDATPTLSLTDGAHVGVRFEFD